MRGVARTLAVLMGMAALALPASPQQPPANADTDWDIAVVLGEIGAHHGRLREALGKIDVKSWIAKGAPETYAEQLESAKQQAAAVETGCQALVPNPERLAAGLELYFRIQGIDAILAAVEDGMRKYQSPAGADALASQQAMDGQNGDRFRRYLVALVGQQEKEMEIMDREAQRCRAAVAARPAPPPCLPAKKK